MVNAAYHMSVASVQTRKKNGTLFHRLKKSARALTAVLSYRQSRPGSFPVGKIRRTKARKEGKLAVKHQVLQLQVSMETPNAVEMTDPRGYLPEDSPTRVLRKRANIRRFGWANVVEELPTITQIFGCDEEHFCLPLGVPFYTFVNNTCLCECVAGWAVGIKAAHAERGCVGVRMQSWLHDHTRQAFGAVTYGTKQEPKHKSFDTTSGISVAFLKSGCSRTSISLRTAPSCDAAIFASCSAVSRTRFGARSCADLLREDASKHSFVSVSSRSNIAFIQTRHDAAH